MNHLTHDELIDAVEDTLAAARRGHLHECAPCRTQLAQLSAVLREARAADSVPEPSPLFWDHFADRVRHAIAAEPAPRPLLHWFQWRVLAPLAGLAILVFALGSSLPDGTFTSQPQIAGTGAPVPVDATASSEVDDGWEVVSELIGDLDFETAQEAGIVVGLGSAEELVAELSAVEQEELLRLLRAELQRAGG